jgi:hypothetical protein
MRQKIYNEIEEERSYQDSLWGDEFDKKNTLNDWVSYMNTYSGQASKIGTPKEEQRRQLLKAVTIGVAALERFDTDGGFAPRHYDDE